MAKFLREVLQDAKSQIKGVTASVGNEVNQGVRGAVRNVTNDIKTAGAGVVNDALRYGVRAAVGSAASVFQGTAVGDFIQDAFGSFLPSGYSINSSDFNTSDHELGQALKMADPALSFLWTVDMPPISGGGNALPSMYAEEATLPHRTFQTRSIFREGKERHYAGSYSLDNLRMVFYKDMGNTTLNYLLSWNDSILTRTNYAVGSGSSGADDPTTNNGKFLAPTNYKKDIVFFLISPQRQVIVEMIYRGCWPTNLGSLNLNSNSDRLRYEVEFQVDDVYINVGSLSETTIKDFMGQRKTMREGIQEIGANISGQIRSAVGVFLPSF